MSGGSAGSSMRDEKGESFNTLRGYDVTEVEKEGEKESCVPLSVNSFREGKDEGKGEKKKRRNKENGEKSSLYPSTILGKG